VVRQLSKMLKRRSSVNHLYQAVCLVIEPNQEGQVYEKVIHEWRRLDVQRLLEEGGALRGASGVAADEARADAERFGAALTGGRAPFVAVIAWVKNLVENRCKVK